MSSRPIGTIIPEAAPSFLVQLLIPENNGFRAQEVSIPVEGLIPASSSGSWTLNPDSSFDSASAITAYFIKVANAIHISISISITNTSLVVDGIVTIPLPEEYVLATATLGDASFQGNYTSSYPKTEYPSIIRPVIAGVVYGGGFSAVQMQLFTDASPLASYEGFISGIGILANQ